MVNIFQIVQIQQARVIFNPLTDILTKCFSFCFILISLPLQDLNFLKKELKVIMEDPQNWCSRNASFLWKRACWFSGEIMPNDERSRSLWASATLPVFRNLTTKRWIVLSSCRLFLPKSFLHCCFVRRTDFAAKYASMIFISCCVAWCPLGSILVSKESHRPAVYATWKIWKKNCKTQLWDEKQNRALFLGHPVNTVTLLQMDSSMGKQIFNKIFTPLKLD